MIIECPACESRYRIREDKLPTDGGNIKCPNCAHVFYVAARDEAFPPVSEPVPVAPPPPTPADEPPTPGKSKDRWKLKNEVGLVFEFPTTDQLRAWLTARESLEGLTVSNDGGATFAPVPSFDALGDVVATGRKTVMGVAAITGPPPVRRQPQNSGSQPVTEESMRQAAQARLRVARKQRETDQEKARDAEFRIVRPPPTEDAAKTSRMLGLMAAVILPLFAVAALNVAGVIDLGAVLRELMPEPDELETNPPPPQPAMAVPTARGNTIDLGEDQPEEATPRSRSIWYGERAAVALSAGETQTAIGYLEQAAALTPDETQLQCQLANLYEQVGNDTASAAAHERCEGTEAAPQEIPAPTPEQAPAQAPEGTEPAPTEQLPPQ